MRDVKWRTWLWDFQAIEKKHALTRFGYTTTRTARGIDGPIQQLDDMSRYIFFLLPSFSLLWVDLFIQLVSS